MFGVAVNVTNANVVQTDVVQWSFASGVAFNPGVLTVTAWPTNPSGGVNFDYCNPTAASVTPTANTLNWRVTR